MKIPALNIPKPDFSKLLNPFRSLSEFFKNTISLLKIFWNIPFSFYFFTLLLAWIFIAIVHFAYPLPNMIFFPVFLMQFLLGFMPNLFYRRTGRIFTAAGALILSRVSELGQDNNFITLSGLFTGAISGIFLREIFSFLVTVDTTQETDPVRRILALNRPTMQVGTLMENLNFGVIIFILALTGERLVVLFNGPYLKGLGFLATMYFQGVSSRTAFSFSVNILASLIFPLLYIMLEERTSPETNKPYNHWVMGLVAGFISNFLLIFIQYKYNIHFFNRVKYQNLIGFLSSASSSSWILAILLSFFIFLVMNKKGIWRNSTRRIIIFLLVSGGILSLPLFDVSFQVIFSFALLVMLYFYLFKSIKIKLIKYIFLMSIIVILPLFLFFIYRVNATNEKSNPQTLPKMTEKNAPAKPFFIGNLIKANYYQTRLDELKFLYTDNKLKSFATNRYSSNKAAIDFFKPHPLFGNGVGSFKLILKDKDPEEKKYPLAKNSAPSLVIGILNDVGLMGSLAIGLWIFMQLIYRKNLTHSLFLIIPFMLDYQINHPDSAFIGIILLSLSSSKLKEKKWIRISNTFIIGMATLFFIHSLFEVNLEPRGPAFRKFKTGKYQLFASEEYKNIHGIQYHVFRGKVMLALAEKTLNFPLMVDDTTLKNKININVIILDAEFQELKKININIFKNILTPVRINLPQESKYVMIDPVNDQRHSIVFNDDLPYCIPVKNFTFLNSIH